MQLIFKTTALASFILILAGCGNSSKDKRSELNDKKVQLEKLKKQQEDLNKQIGTLEEDIAKIDTAAAKVEKAKLVSLTTLAAQSFTHYVDLQGKIDAENISYVTPRGQGGQVRAIYVKQGDYVKKGQLLLKLDNAVVSQQVEQAKIQLSYAEDLYNRRKNLWDQKIGTEVELITAKNNVEQAKKNLALLQEQASFANVYAQVSGVADEVTIKVGEMFTGSPLAGIKIVNNRDLKAVVSVPENYLTKIKKGAPAVISIPDLNKTFNSSISVIGQALGTISMGFTAEMKMPYDPAVKPNLTALVKIQDYHSANAIAVPLNTLQTDENGKYVLVAATEKDKMVARKRQVTEGEVYGDKIEIKTGLKAGDVIITEGFQNLYDGQLITTENK